MENRWVRPQKKWTRPEWNRLIKEWDKINECRFLSMAEKHVMCEIASLSLKQGYCNASDKFLADKWAITPQDVSRHIKNLYEFGFIRKERVRFSRQRHIYIEWGIIDLRRDEPRRKSLFISATHKDFLYYFREMGREWEIGVGARHLDAALKEYIKKCHEIRSHVSKGDVKEQAQYLIDKSGGDVQKAITLLDAAVDEERELTQAA